MKLMQSDDAAAALAACRLAGRRPAARAPGIPDSARAARRQQRAQAGVLAGPALAVDRRRPMTSARIEATRAPPTRVLAVASSCCARRRRRGLLVVVSRRPSSGNAIVGDPGNCLVVDLTMSTEKIDLLTSLAQAFNQTKAEGRRQVRVRAARTRKASGGADAGAGRRLEHRRRRPDAGHLVPGVERLGRGPRPAARPTKGETGHGQAGHAVHEHAARHRHAPADGRGPRLAGQGARLERHPEPGHEHAGLGRVRPSRMGSVPPRQDQPQLLDVGPARPDRPELRSHRQDPRPHAGGPGQARGQRLRHLASSPRSCTTATPR